MTTDLLSLLEEADRFSNTRKLMLRWHKPPGSGGGAPYAWQSDFANASADHAEQMICAGNQVGKNHTAAAMVACHVTGRYPPWYTGFRFHKPIEALIVGISNQFVRDTSQLDLFGAIDISAKRPDGTGWIPLEDIADVTFRSCGVMNVLDTVKVRHVSGGLSTCYMMAYEQGTTKFQGFKRDLAWLDEEPEDSVDQRGIFPEVQTRLVSRGGRLIATRTPLFGMTPLIKHFRSGAPGVMYKCVTWDEAPHLNAEARARLLETYPEHERATRTQGIPLMGSGAVFPVADQVIEWDQNHPIPDHWRRICGVDFGIDHYAAACWIAYDADGDCIYVYDCYRAKNQTSVYHAAAIRERGDWIPVAWPHDGMQRGKADGKALSDAYREAGANLMWMSARYDDETGGAQPIEPGIMDMLERMRTGRFKVAKHLNDWWEEKRSYHRKDGKIVQENDDILSACRYAVMMVRYAATKAEVVSPRQSQAAASYDPLAGFMR